MFGKSGGHSVTPLIERSRVGANIAGGLVAGADKLGQAMMARKRAKELKKGALATYQGLLGMEKADGKLDDDKYEELMAFGEGASTAELQGMLAAYARSQAMKADRSVTEDRKARLGLAQSADARAQEQHQAAMAAVPVEREMRARTFEMGQERHQAQMEAAKASLDQQEQTNQVALAMMQEPKTITEVNFPVPGMDTVAGQTAPEAPTVTRRKQTQREMVVEAAAKNPKARISDIIKHMGASQPSVSDQIAVKKYQDSIKEREVAGVGLARSAQAAKDVIEFKTTTEDASKGIDGLLEILDTPRRYLSPAKRAEAKTMGALLKGSLRLPIVGPGAMSEKEMALLDDVVANPTKIMKLDEATRASLEKLKSVLKSQLETRYRNSIIDYQAKEEPLGVWTGYNMQ